MPNTHEHDEANDPVADLIRQAGPTTALPDFALEELAAPALAAWNTKVRSRRRKRRLALLAAAALLALGTLVLWRLFSPSQTVPTVVAAGGGSHFEVGTKLAENARVATGSEPAEWITLRLSVGHEIRIDAATEIDLPSDRRIDLLQGAVYVVASEAPLIVHASNLETEHLGTRYEVRVHEDGSSEVRVREGRVRASLSSGSMDIERGQRLVVSPAAEITVAESPPFGASWDWTRHAAPAFASDGATLEELLDWVAGETGRHIEFDPQLVTDEGGQPVRIYGSIEGLEPLEALQQVLDGAGLEARRSGEHLRVFDGPE
ncbi:MAG: FecR domain-containing protein [Thermoanaerobaculia bacterium]|nr:FecR domain-containing protein [Thermoanaerobaculia bacterium]